MAETDPQQLLHRLALGDPEIVSALVEEFGASDDATTLVVVALFVRPTRDLLRRAGVLAQTTRERQLVAIAGAHLRGDDELVDALARDHLTDHPDSVIVAWIAAAGRHDKPVHPHPC